MAAVFYWIVVRDAHSSLRSRRLFEQTKQRLESYPKSIEQHQCLSRLNTHGRTWNGQRSWFVLSGLMRCSLCGSRYQGVTRTKGKKR
ncbi:zinc ribbon domain-containing protein [Planctomycetota bacterium]